MRLKGALTEEQKIDTISRDHVTKKKKEKERSEGEGGGKGDERISKK